MNDELPEWLAGAIDKPLVGPIALVVLGLVTVLWLGHMWDAWTTRRHHQILDDCDVPRPGLTTWTDADDDAMHAWASREAEK